MFLLAIGVANAQTEKTAVANVQETEVVAQEQVEQEKAEIKHDALPSKVQEVLKSDRFNTWEVSKAYEMTDKKDKKVYEVVLTNGEKKATYKFDAEGKTIG